MKVKVPTFVRSLIDKGFDRLWERRISQGYDPKRTIVVAGTPRGGTTWVAEALAEAPGYLPLLEPEQVFHVAETLVALPGYCLLWEPLQPFYSDPLETADGAPAFYVTTNCVLREHFKNITAGKVRISKYLGKLGGLRYLVSEAFRRVSHFQRLVVKFVYCNLLLHWILKEFELKGVLLLRHPCAVVSSQMHHKFYGQGTGEPKTLDHIRRHRLPIYEQFAPAFAKVIRSIQTDEELLALEWCIRTIVPLQQPKPHPWFLTTYEDLIESTEEWERLCNYLECPVPSKDVITRFSTTYQKRGDESPGVYVDKWRRHLSEKQVDDILRVCSEMGVDFYDKTPYPRNLDKYR